MVQNDLLYNDNTLKEYYPDMMYVGKNAEYVIYDGMIHYRAHYEGRNKTIEGSDKIQIHLPLDSKRNSPKAYEIGGKIPRFPDNHIPTYDGEMCLGAPSYVGAKYAEHPCPSHFIRSLVVPFLGNFYYKQIYGFMPDGELAHGYEGILQFYQDQFYLESKEQVKDFFVYILKAMFSYNQKYRGHHLCPCGSNKIIRKCHKEELTNTLTQTNLLGLIKEYDNIRSIFSDTQKEKINKIIRKGNK